MERSPLKQKQEVQQVQFALVVFFRTDVEPLRTEYVRNFGLYTNHTLSDQLLNALPLYNTPFGWNIPEGARFKAFWYDENDWIVNPKERVSPEDADRLFVAVDENLADRGIWFFRALVDAVPAYKDLVARSASRHQPQKVQLPRIINPLEYANDNPITSSNKVKPSVFISYSHADSEWLNRLRIHLRPLERKGLILPWDDTRIEPGMLWKEEIGKALDSARIAILLVSADFLASDFIADNELPPLLASAEKHGTSIFPVILTPCLFAESELSGFQSINPPSKPLVMMSKADQEQVLVSIAQATIRAINK